ncbi:CBS domain-containing protein [Brevundimonas subvibrioides]|uniref:CBS domain-containing protein n=1 Tax=Brevundimonas subvibrioides TaxID=74313 RepID=UPI0022B5C77B|nr:CBS domain-containing protein [Brevundimonas subvibrioides]
MKIKDMMSRDVQVARSADPIQEVAARMGAGNFGFLPVSDGDTLIGTITDRDIAVRGTGQGKPGAAPVSEVMTAGATTVLDSDDLKSALDLMASGQIRRLPVLDRHGKLVGVVSLGDLSARVKATSIGVALETISASA